MDSPWLALSLSDYEAHMESAEVQQAAMLRAELRRAVERYRPRTVAILGAAGGNGLADLRDLSVEHVIAIDLNSEYLDVCRSRYGGESWSLHPLRWDLSSSRPPIESMDLVFAALVIEYIDAGIFAAYAPSLLADSGRLLMIFQNVDDTGSAVSPSGIESLRSLETIHHAVDVNQLTTELSRSGGLVLEDSATLSSAAGKNFSLRVMRRPPPGFSRSETDDYILTRRGGSADSAGGRIPSMS